MKSSAGEIIVAVFMSGVAAVLTAVAGFVGAIFLVGVFLSGEMIFWGLILAPATALVVALTVFVITFRTITTYGEHPDTVPLGASGITERPQQRRTVFVFIAVYIVILLTIFAFVGRYAMQNVRDRRAWIRAHQGGSQHLGRTVPVQHEGPVASVDELKGSGRIYLTQMGPHKAPYSLEDLAQWLRSKYALDVQVLPAMDLDHATLDLSRAWDFQGAREQYVAELLCEQMKRAHPDLAADKDAYLIGITEADMYSVYYKWRSTFSQRDEQRAAIVSADGMRNLRWEMPSQNANVADREFQVRLRRILLKDIAVLYWHLPLNNDPTSLLHQTLDPDVPTEDIYESDLAPARTKSGENVSDPCVVLTYSSKDGVRPLAGASIHQCWGQSLPQDDESLEMFQVDLGTGMLIDRHTDFDLPDAIPIQFQRVTRDGWSRSNPLGISGTDNYDDFLQSADNVTIAVIRSDGGRENVVRVPRWLPILAWVKYVDTDFSGKFYEMRWPGSPFEHYDMKRFDGVVETFLPCDSPQVMCYLTGYRNAKGQELKFERDSSRKLRRLTSPNNSWLRMSYGPSGGISELEDSRGRMVRYGYDERNRMVSVTYPSGEVFHYEYDITQHLLTFSVAPNSAAVPSVLLRNEYENGRLAKQTFGDGQAYAYKYESAKDGSIRASSVRTPDGRAFHIDFADGYSTVREQIAQPRAVESPAASK